ncbi:MAG: hypothetical protein AABZ13_00100, partial [Planctomycetota bacterium]
TIEFQIDNGMFCSYSIYITILMAYLNLNVWTAVIENEILPLKDESINIIIANQILEHTKEIFWIFKEFSFFCG